ncbi:hypothetical protein UCRPC4_g04153 [Phaeomoniella chlamydospora]|uniref:Uncharacterized protein n=1 Tax=Phaeomoniella chlamydospora TaxID=158046 RepID=A0A0G2EEH6_PHACM|nr:hypothetical protein UCRPC4_g04153 [Phaeomoniella chlamydospora]
MSVQIKQSTQSSHINKNIANNDQRELDGYLQKLSTETLPQQPYIINLPTDSPWHPGARPRPRWYTGTPFSKDEEALQYLTFIPYHREYRGEGIIIVSEGGWSDARGNILRLDDTPPSRPSSSGAHIQRKKITLDAYKNKGRSGSEEVAPDMERAQATIRKADEGLKHASQRSPKPLINGVKKNAPSELKKRPREEIDTSKRIEITGEKAKSPRPEKKPRMSPPPQKQQQKPDRSKSPENTDFELPSLESPTLPPTLDDISLPPLVSPTLPPYVEKLLADNPVKPLPNGGGLDGNHPEHDPSVKTNHDSELSPAPRVRVRNADSPVVSAQNTPKVTPTKHHDSIKKSLVDKAKGRDRGDSNVIDGSPSTKAKDMGKLGNTDRQHSRPKLRVVLRYGKKNRKRVEQLLRFATRPPKKTATSNLAVANHDLEALAIKDNQPPSKRPKLEGSEAPLTRKAPSAPNISERPKTPVDPSFPSPGLQSGYSKSTFSTPQKSLKSVAMRRVESTEGTSDARTPQGLSRTSTPVSSERHSRQENQAKSSPSVAQSAPVPVLNNVTSDPLRPWYRLHHKYFDLGRSLKHQASAIQNKRPPTDSAQAKLAVASSLEALLCFILGQFCLERARSGADWRSTLPYWENVRDNTRAFPDLYGLATHLGAFLRNVVHRVDMEKLIREPIPFESTIAHDASAPTPGSDGTAKTNIDDESRRKYLAFQKDCYDNYRALNNLWLDATRRLSPERLEKKFPGTWSKKVPLVDREKDRILTAGDPLKGDYSFPIEPSTTALEAVRFGMRMLKEWCRNENTEWTAQLQL